MLKRTLSVAVLGLALAWSSPAAADTISFDTNGALSNPPGATLDATIFDWLPGNSLIVEHNDGTATVYYQANLGTIQTTQGPGPGDTNDFSNCSDGAMSCFTAVATFDILLQPTSPTSTNYLIIPGSGELKIYADSTTGNNLAGTGFTDGTEILSATVLTGSGTFAFNPLVAPTALDNYLSPVNATAVQTAEAGGNNYPGVTTLSGTGSVDLFATVTSFDSSYFLNLVTGATFAYTNSSQIDPYNQVNPSGLFTNILTSGTVTGVGSVGLVNGLGNNIIAQADANSSITFTNPVPEPASLTLLGLGLAGSVAARRRQKKAQQQKA